MNPTGGELQPRPANPPVPYRGQHSNGEVTSVINWPELAVWTRGRGVVVAGVALIAVSLIWKAIFLSHYYFWQDDFHFTELALGHSFSWSYLTYVGAGHMFPGVYAIVWLWARAALYSWTAASAMSLITLAVAGLAALRLLRTLFGNRPAILVLLLIYLISPLLTPDIRWWSSAMESLPLQVVIFMAITAQVYYVRTGRFRHALAAAAWLVVGLLFFEKAAVLPVVLFLVTSGFLLDDGNWLRSIGRCLRRFWPSWLLQAVIVAGYAIVLKNALKTSAVQPAAPKTPGAVISFAWNLLKESFVPGAIGGPWQWFPQGPVGSAEWAYASPPKALIWLSMIVAACVIGASIWARRYAWRAWVILAVWFLLADVTPIALGRINELGPAGPILLALDTHYVSDAVPILAICLGLAFLPIDGRLDLRQKRRMAALQGVTLQPGRMVAAGLVGAFIIGSVWSSQLFESDTTSQPVRSYLTNAQAAVTQAPAGTVIVPTLVPSDLMIGAFGKWAQTSLVIGPMEDALAKSKIRWTTRPNGTIDHLYMFGTDGRLHTVGLYGYSSVALKSGCNRPNKNGDLVIPFTKKTLPGDGVLNIAYDAANGINGEQVTVKYGNGATQQLTLKGGLHNAYLPVRGSARTVTVSEGPAGRPSLCIGTLREGFLYQLQTGPTIPAAF